MVLITLIYCPDFWNCKGNKFIGDFVHYKWMCVREIFMFYVDVLVYYYFVGR